MSLGLKPTYLRTFSGVIWKMVYDPYYSRIALEIRSEASLEWFYHIIHLNDLTDQQVFPQKELEWWSQLSGIYSHNLILMNYENQNNPGPGTLIFYDFEKKQVVKREDNLLIKSIEANKIVTEKVSGESEKEEFEIYLKDKVPDPQEIGFPALYKTGTEDHEVVSTFVQKSFGTSLVADVEYYQNNSGQIFFSYYKENNSKMDRFMVVVNHGVVSLNEKIDEKMDGIATESFFLFGKFLIFVSNRNTVNIYEV